MQDTGRIERIACHEDMAERAKRTADRLEQALAEYEKVLPLVSELDAYYSGPEWRADYEADEAGLLPADLKRGILSEDGLYNLLERYRELKEQLRHAAEK